ncbi:nucleotidyltransferase [Lacticaseibacillus thailandensis]|nr:nucleotidyltransferase [Lacticaseibacillus thailandensis]
MQAVGVVAEFNPLHNGHVFALQVARRRAAADVVVVVMSGNFVQRGAPAILDKWTRTRLALTAGADLVVELPVYDAVQSGNQFAAGALAQLSALGVSQLAFGTEAPELDYAQLAERMHAMMGQRRDEFHDYTQTYASQLAAAMTAVTGHAVKAPNQMLGVSYAMANLALTHPLTLLPFGRAGVDHDAAKPQAVAGTTMASASAIRERVHAGADVRALVPAATATALRQGPILAWRQLWPLLRYRLQTASLDELATIDQATEGLEHRLRAAAIGAHDFDDLLRRAKSKRYTYARLRRLALAITLNLRHGDVVAARRQRNVHILGFNAVGRAYLKQVKKQAPLPLVSRVSRDMLKPDGSFDLIDRADALISTLTGYEQNYGRVPIMEDLNNA